MICLQCLERISIDKGVSLALDLIEQKGWAFGWYNGLGPFFQVEIVNMPSPVSHMLVSFSAILATWG